MTIFLVVIALTLVACTPKVEEKQSFVQQKFANVSETLKTENKTIIDVDKLINSSALKCDYYNIDYYVKEIFIYFVNAKGDQTILTPQGTYFKPNKYPNWQFKVFLNKINNTYSKRKAFIELGEFPNGDVLTCENVDSIPEKFNEFIKTHMFLITKPKKEE